MKKLILQTSRRRESENLFEELCQQHGVEFDRIPVNSDSQQPDYELVLASGQKVIAEVKQIDPNKNDRRAIADLECEGLAIHHDNFASTVPRRVQNAITKSRKQINSYLDIYPNLPALLILYDATGTDKYTDSYGIKIAMYGLDRFVISTSSPYSVIDCGSVGHNVAVRRDKNRQLSALATLHKCFSIDTGERFLSLLFYHNLFAKHRMEPGWWTGDHIAHYVLEEQTQGEFQNWIKVA